MSFLCLAVIDRFASNLDTHLKEVVLQHLPTNFQDINKKRASKQ